MATDKNNKQTQESAMLQEIDTAKPKDLKLISIILFVVISAIVLGSLSGYFFWQKQTSKSKINTTTAPLVTKNGQVPPEPQQDTQTFRDSAEGVVEKNDSANQYGQGTHKLVRPGGQTQTAYLVSSVVDLDQYVGKKVVVKGETFQSAQVGWLMDVGKVEVKE